MEKHEPRGFAYTIVRSDGETFGPCVYRGGEAAYVFLSDILQKEKWLRELMADKKPLVMMHENWQKHIAAADCHICNKSLVKDLFLDSMPVHDNDTGRYCGQSHRKCYYEAMKKITLLAHKGKGKMK